MVTAAAASEPPPQRAQQIASPPPKDTLETAAGHSPISPVIWLKKGITTATTVVTTTYSARTATEKTTSRQGRLEGPGSPGWTAKGLRQGTGGRVGGRCGGWGEWGKLRRTGPTQTRGKEPRDVGGPSGQAGGIGGTRSCCEVCHSPQAACQPPGQARSESQASPALAAGSTGWKPTAAVPCISFPPRSPTCRAPACGMGPRCSSPGPRPPQQCSG